MADGDDVDDEFGAMQAVYSALVKLDEAAQQRVLDYVSSRLGLAVTSSAAEPKKQSVGSESVDTEVEGSGEEQGQHKQSEYGSFAELYDAAQPKTQADKALVGGYWLQVCQGGESFDSFSVNKELKNLGEGVGHITSALETLKGQKPALCLQLKKSGKSRQARKTYKLTVAGIKEVEAMVGG